VAIGITTGFKCVPSLQPNGSPVFRGRCFSVTNYTVKPLTLLKKRTDREKIDQVMGMEQTRPETNAGPDWHFASEA